MAYPRAHSLHSLVHGAIFAAAITISLSPFLRHSGYGWAVYLAPLVLFPAGVMMSLAFLWRARDDADTGFRFRGPIVAYQLLILLCLFPLYLRNELGGFATQPNGIDEMALTRGQWQAEPLTNPEPTSDDWTIAKQLADQTPTGQRMLQRELRALADGVAIFRRSNNPYTVQRVIETRDINELSSYLFQRFRSGQNNNALSCATASALVASSKLTEAESVLAHIELVRGDVQFVWASLGNVNLERLQLDRAEAITKRLLAIEEDAVDDGVLVRLADIFSARGRFRESSDMLAKALAITPEDSREQRGILLVKMADQASSMADSSTALNLLQRALTVTESPHVQIAANLRVAMNLADSNHERSDDAIRRALHEAERSGNAVFTASILRSAGEVKLVQKDWDAAQKYLVESSDIYKRLGRKTDEADALTMLGFAYLQSGEIEEAQRTLDASLAIYGSNGSYGKATALANYATVLMKLNDVDSARTNLTSALSILSLSDGAKVGEVEQQLAAIDQPRIKQPSN